MELSHEVWGRCRPTIFFSGAMYFIFSNTVRNGVRKQRLGKTVVEQSNELIASLQNLADEVPVGFKNGSVESKPSANHLKPTGTS